MFLLQRLTILLEESYEYGADVGGSRGLCCGLLGKFSVAILDIFLRSRFLYESMRRYF